MKQLEQLLKEKWFLVAADALVVIGILSLGLDPSNNFQASLAVLGILAAALIVLIPVLREDFGSKQRLAEQARLRAALAAEIDQLRGDLRTTLESTNRRAVDTEVTAKKTAEAAAEAVARKASTELATLRALVAASAEGIDELRTQIQSAVDVARGVASDVESALEQAEAGSQAKAIAEQATQALAQLRQQIDADHQALQKIRSDLSAGREALAKLTDRVDDLNANPSKASTPNPNPASRTVESEAKANRDNITPLPARDDEDELSLGLAATPDVDEDDEDLSELAPTPAPEPLMESRLGDGDDELDAVSQPPAAEVAQLPPTAVMAKTVMASEDDAEGTCVIANLMIGIGNKPFVRGTGPGLSEATGVPMEFLAIGRWLWRSPDSSQSATIQIWKNDQSPLGEPVHIRAGETRELEEDFFAS